jgi:hypothetical protein
MSFGDYSFAGGQVRIAHKKSLKCAQNLEKYISDMHPRGKAPQPIKTGPKQEENKEKPTSNHLIFAEYQHRPTQDVQRS